MPPTYWKIFYSRVGVSSGGGRRPAPPASHHAIQIIYPIRSSMPPIVFIITISVRVGSLPTRRRRSSCTVLPMFREVSGLYSSEFPRTCPSTVCTISLPRSPFFRRLFSDRHSVFLRSSWLGLRSSIIPVLVVLTSRSFGGLTPSSVSVGRFSY